MSTIYTINAEASTTVSSADQFPMYKTSTGRTMKVSGDAIRTHVLGTTSTQTLGFFGATAIARPSGAAQADILSTASISTDSTAKWGYATSTQADGLVTLLRKIRGDLVDLGLINGS